MKAHHTLNVLTALLFFLTGASLGKAQVSYSTATLRGTVVDPAGGVVPGAQVTATNPATGMSKTVKTGADGTYQIPELSPGAYDIEVNAAGFAKSLAKGVELTVGRTVVYDAHLQVGSDKSVVEVSINALLIETEQTQQANTINQRQVEELPNITRSFTAPVYTAPGVVYSHGPSIQDSNVGTGYLSSGFSFGGSTGRNNLVTIDGGENDYGSGALRVTHVPLDSIQEFQINRNSFSAEFGYTIGSAINMVTKGGTNNYHGGANVYFHDHATDAVNYFNKLLAPGSSPFEQSVIAGATLGGPIQKDKVFFFTSYEYQKLDATYFQNLAAQTEFQPLSTQPNGFTGSNPISSQCPNQSTQRVTQLCYLTQLANSGQSFAPIASALIGSTIFSPLGDPTNSIPAHPILNALVAPNDGAFNGVISVIGAERGIPGFNTPRGRYNNWVSRLDFLPRSKDSLFLRFSYLNETDNVVPQPPTSTFDHFHDYTLTTSWTHTFNPNRVNTVRFQYVPQNTALNRTPTNLQGPCGLDKTSGNLTGGCASEIDIGNQIVLGNPFAFPYDADWKRFQFDDTMAWIKGAHSLKFGGSYRPNYYSVNEQLWFGGEWSFTDGAIPIIALFPSAPGSCGAVSCQQAVGGFNLAAGYAAAGPASTNLNGAQEYVTGLPIVFLQASPSSNSLWKAWDNTLGLFAEDSWKISKKLTLNYGLRLDYDHPANPVPHSVYASPRLGVAWDPVGDGKTVLRAGGGMFVAPVLFMIPFYTNSLGNSGKYINQGGLSASYPAGFPAPGPACPAGVAAIFCAWGVQKAIATPANPNPALSPTELGLAGAGAILNPFGPTGVGTVLFNLGPNFKPAYSIQASASVARQIAPSLSLEIGYNMYRTVHAELNLEKNYCNLSLTSSPDFCGGTPVPADPFIGPFYTAKPGVTTNPGGASQPNVLIFQNNTYSSEGSGIYHGLTASLTKQYGHGLQLQANYTYSRAIDDTSDYSSLTTPFRSDLFKLDRSVSLFNITHSFAFNAVYNTPFKAGEGIWSTLFADVSIAPIVSAHSGLPFTLLVPGLGGAAGNGAGGHISQARPYNEPRNVAIGPDFAGWDMRVSKAFFIHRESGLRLDLIAQATNLLNRNNFAAVNNNFPADPNFPLPNGGTLSNGPYRVRGFAPTSASQLSNPLVFTKAYPPRQISVALRLAF